MDKRFEFYKEQYYFELNRRSEITSSLVIPIGFLTALFTGYSYFCLNLIYLNTIIISSVFIVLIITSLFFGVTAITHLFKSLRGLAYGYVPEPLNLYTYEQNFIEYIKANELSPDLIDVRFFEYLKKSIVTTTNKNRENNNFRANRILKANINTIYAIFFLFLATVPYITCKNIYDSNQLKKNDMPTETQKSNQNADNNPAIPLPATNPLPPEPIFPVDQYVVESKIIPIPPTPPTKDINCD